MTLKSWGETTGLSPAGWLEKNQNLYFTIGFICLDEILKNGLCWEVESVNPLVRKQEVLSYQKHPQISVVIPRIHVIFRQQPIDLEMFTVRTQVPCFAVAVVVVVVFFLLLKCK